MNGPRRRSRDLIRGGGTAGLIEGGRTRSEASATTTRVELLDEAGSTFTLKLGMSVRGEIEAECRRINELARAQVGRPAESGGYLFSHYGARTDGAHVVYASASGEEHTTHSVLLASPTDVKRDIAAGLPGEGLARAGLPSLETGTPIPGGIHALQAKTSRTGQSTCVAWALTPGPR